MEISAFLDRKLARRFKTFDTDGDGFVEREDFELTVNRMGKEFGLTPDDEKLQRLRVLSLGVWPRTPMGTASSMWMNRSAGPGR